MIIDGIIGIVITMLNLFVAWYYIYLCKNKNYKLLLRDKLIIAGCIFIFILFGFIIGPLGI